MRHFGFTLIELLVAIAVIGVIAGIVIIAVNPRKNFISAYDARRCNDADAICDALYANLIDEWDLAGGGRIEESEERAKPICKERSSNDGTCPSTAVNLNDLPPEYITQIPVDPVMPESDPCTGYMVYTQAGRPKVVAANLGKLPGDAPAPEALCGEGGGGSSSTSSESSESSSSSAFTIPTCNGQTATVYVNASNRIIINGVDSGNYEGVLDGGNQAQIIVGTSGNDLLKGGNSGDSICGGAGDDTICARNGTDTVSGGDGNDAIDAGNGTDTVDGGDQTDICRDAEVQSKCEDATTPIPACN